MMTKGQIACMRRWADYHLDYYVHDAEGRAHNCGELVRDLAAAYERVATLLATWEAPAGPCVVADNRTPFAAALRRALEG